MPQGDWNHQIKQQTLLNAIFGAAVDGILTIDPVGTILTANPAIERIFGYALTEIIGQNVRMLMPSGYREEHDQYLRNYLDTGVRKIIGIGREVEGLRKDGVAFPIDLAVSEAQTDEGPIFVGIIRDITERHRAEEDIRRERALLKAVVETAVDGIMTIDERGMVLSANPAVQEIFGYRPAELIGLNVSVLMPSPYHEEHDGYLMNYRSTGVRKIIGIGRKVFGRRSNGEIFPLDLAVSETTTETGTIFTGIVRDISERVQAVELQIAKDAADQANAAKSEFLSRMSHELRTPLNAVLGFAQLLDMRYEDPKIQQATHSILKAGQHLLNLINEVLDLSRIEAGRLTLSMEPILLSQVLHQASDIAEPIAFANQITIEVQMNDLKDVYVMADRQRLLQVVINLLTNAIKFNRPGGKVEVVCDTNAEGIRRIFFRDTGFGIPEEHIERLFQPFERLGDVSIEGTGLGLVLSRRFVELMNGTLTLVESGPLGSTFCVELVEASARETKGAIVGRVASRSERAPLHGKVLYIEDNLSNLRLVEMILEAWPELELIPAMQGKVGLEIASGHRPDIIFLDLHLPDLPGIEVLQRVKADADTSQIPVIVISADATPGQIRRLKLAGAVEYLTKPLDIERFVQILETYLKKDDAE